MVIGLSGISGSGKTYTALQLAWGLANGDASKVGLLDTENRRGSLYADSLRDKQGKVHQFLIGDLYAPFSPERYRQAILEFQKAGVEVLVIDSGSHEWEGEGGCEDIAHAPDAQGRAPRNPRWNEAKRQHKAFMNTLLQCDMHIIVCLRAREKVKLVKREGKTEYEPIGIMPICEKNFMFELTASLMMWNEGQQQEVMKCPQELRDILGRGTGYITARDGLALRKWVEGGVQLDQSVEHARNSLRTVTEQGTQAVRQAWDATAEDIRGKLGAAYLHELLEAAQAYEDQREAAAGEATSAALDDLNSAVLGGQQQEAQ